MRNSLWTLSYNIIVDRIYKGIDQENKKYETEFKEWENNILIDDKPYKYLECKGNYTKSSNRIKYKIDGHTIDICTNSSETTINYKTRNKEDFDINRNFEISSYNYLNIGFNTVFLVGNGFFRCRLIEDGARHYEWDKLICEVLPYLIRGF